MNFGFFMLKIGLTGGIGTGKSTVANIFKVLGAPVFEADAVAKQVMENDLNLREQLIQQFGAACFQNGQLNRAYLASIVFKDPYQLALLNAMVHPITLKAAADWMKLQTGPYAIKEAALIFEAGAGAGLDVIIGVTAPTAIRIQRVMQRDGSSMVKRNSTIFCTWRPYSFIPNKFLSVLYSIWSLKFIYKCMECPPMAEILCFNGKLLSIVIFAAWKLYCKK